MSPFGRVRGETVWDLPPPPRHYDAAPSSYPGGCRGKELVLERTTAMSRVGAKGGEAKIYTLLRTYLGLIGTMHRLTTTTITTILRRRPLARLSS